METIAKLIEVRLVSLAILCALAWFAYYRVWPFVIKFIEDQRTALREQSVAAQATLKEQLAIAQTRHAEEARLFLEALAEHRELQRELHHEVVLELRGLARAVEMAGAKKV